MENLGFLLVLGAVLALSVASVTDKVFVSPRIDSELLPAVYTKLLISLGGVSLFATPLARIPHNQTVVIAALVAGPLFVLSAVVYFAGVKNGDITTIVVFINSKPLLVIVGAAMFLGELLTLVQYVGIVCITLSAMLLSVARDEDGLEIHSTAKYGVTLAVLIASTDLLSKFSVSGSSAFDFFATSRISSLAFSTLLLGYMLVQYRDETIGITREWRQFWPVATRSVLFFIGYCAFFIGIETVPISIASTLFTLQNIIVFGIMFVLVSYTKTNVSFSDASPLVKTVSVFGVSAGVALLYI